VDIVGSNERDEAVEAQRCLGCKKRVVAGRRAGDREAAGLARDIV